MVLVSIVLVSSVLICRLNIVSIGISVLCRVCMKIIWVGDRFLVWVVCI